MSLALDPWGEMLRSLVADVCRNSPPGAQRSDFAGTGAIAGWQLATRLALRNPERARAILGAIDAEARRPAEQIAYDERLLKLVEAGR